MFHVYILFLHNFDQIKIVHRVDHIIILSIFFLFERAFSGRCLRCALKRPLLCPACMHYYMCAVALILFDLDTHSTHSSWQSNYHRTLYSINKVRVRCSEANKYTHQTCSHGKWYEFSYCHITYRFIRNLCFFLLLLLFFALALSHTTGHIPRMECYAAYQIHVRRHQHTITAAALSADCMQQN